MLLSYEQGQDEELPSFGHSGKRCREGQDLMPQ